MLATACSWSVSVAVVPDAAAVHLALIYGMGPQPYHPNHPPTEHNLHERDSLNVLIHSNGDFAKVN